VIVTRQQFEARLIGLGLILFLLIAFMAAFIASQRDPGNWTLADWVNFGISILLGLSFLLLAQHVNHNAQRRAEAVANAGLLTSTGMLAMNSARSLLGSESSALRVAADARAALQHYPSVTGAEKTGGKSMKEVLVKSLIDAYIDLAFSTFLHSGHLARSVWTRLCEGTADVVADIDRLAFTKSGDVKDSELASVADHVGFVELLGRALRKDAEKALAFQGSRRLTAVWDSTKLPYVRRPLGIRSEEEEIVYRLDRFEELYKYELTVMHDWEMLRRNANKLCCEVELVSIAATGEWLAPWYVGQGTDGQPKPVNVMGSELNERARYDRLQVDKSTPRWPKPLLHGSLPQGMRSTSIDNHCRVLESQPSPTICVLAYDLCIDARSGKTQRLVLDGNHRLAAARRISLDHNLRAEERSPSPQFKVLTFLIRERQSVDDWSTSGDSKREPARWKGFTPDIGLVRGSWPPSQPRDLRRK
jgi:hypothetical protein